MMCSEFISFSFHFVSFLVELMNYKDSQGQICRELKHVDFLSEKIRDIFLFNDRIRNTFQN